MATAVIALLFRHVQPFEEHDGCGRDLVSGLGSRYKGRGLMLSSEFKRGGDQKMEC